MDEKMRAEALDKISKELDSIKKRVNEMQEQLSSLEEPEVKEEYIDELKKKDKEEGRVFDTKEEMLEHLRNEV